MSGKKGRVKKAGHSRASKVHNYIISIPKKPSVFFEQKLQNTKLIYPLITMELGKVHLIRIMKMESNLIISLVKVHLQLFYKRYIL